MLFSRFLRPSDESSPQESEVPVRRALIWGLAGAAILLGLALYFLYARLLEPLVA